MGNSTNQLSTGPLSYTEPEFDIAEPEKNKEWYRDYVRHYSSFYDVDFGTKNSLSDNSDDHKDRLSPIERAREYSLYYSGKQENIDYNHVTQDISGNALPATWIKGKKIHTLINHWVGTLTTHLASKELSVKNLSKNAVNKHTRMMDNLLLRFDQQAKMIFDEMEKMGISFQPAGDRSFESREEVLRFMEDDWKETGEQVGTDLARHIEQYNSSNNVYITAFLNYCAANYCAVYNYVENGAVIQKHIPFYNLVFIPNDEDPFNKKITAVGFIERLTPQELIKTYRNLSEEDKELIKRFGKDPSVGNELMDTYNTARFQWWTGVEQQKKIATLKMFWIGQHDLNYKQIKGDDGELSYKKVREIKGNHITNDVHTGTLIGNKIMVDYGYADNTVRSAFNKSDPELPIKVLSGRTLMYEGVSPIGKVSQHQDRIDALEFKIMEKIGKDKGKTYIINGDVVDGDAVSIYSDLATLGIHVRVPSGEDNDATDSKRMVETVDMSLDPTVSSYIALVQRQDRLIEDSMGTSQIALGAQTNVIGKAVQQESISRTELAIMGMFDDFIKFNEINLSYSVNLAKMMYTSSGDHQNKFVLGDREVKWLEITKEFGMQDLLLYIKTKDTIDAAGKARLQDYAFAYMQNPDAGEVLLDILKLETAGTYSEASGTLEFAIKQRLRRQSEAAETARQDAKQAQDQALDADAEKTKFEQGQETKRETLRSMTKTESEAMKLNAAEEKNQ